MMTASTDFSPEQHEQHRDALRGELRRCRPKVLVGWRGLSLAGRHVQPYRAFAHAHCRSRPKDEQIAELLIGDVVADALLATDLKVHVEGIDADPPQWIRPYRATS